MEEGTNKKNYINQHVSKTDFFSCQFSYSLYLPPLSACILYVFGLTFPRAQHNSSARALLVFSVTVGVCFSLLF